MKTATTGLYKVVANGTESIALPKKQAERIAKALQTGKGGFAKVAATVVPT